MPTKRRRELHHALAAELASLDEPARAVAHWHLADEPDRAREAALAAARTAEEQLAFRRAADLYGLAGGQTDPSWELTAARGAALAKAGLHRDAAEACEAAARAAPDAEARQLELQAMRSRFSAGDLTGALQLADRLLGRYGDRLARRGGVLAPVRLPLVAWEALKLTLICGVMWILTRLFGWGRRALTDETRFRLRLYDAVRHQLAILNPALAVEAGLKHATLAEFYADPAQRGRARLADALMLAGLLGRRCTRYAMHLVHSGEALCADAQDPEGQLQAQVVRAYLLLLENNYEGVARTARAGERLAERAGLFGDPNLMTLHNLHTGAKIFAGDLPGLQRVAGHYLADARARGNVPELCQNLAALGSSLLAQGKREQAQRAFDEALAVTPASPLTIPRVQLELLVSELLLFDGHSEQALEQLVAVRARWRAEKLLVTSMERALFRLLRGRCRLQMRLQGVPGCTQRSERLGLGLLPAPTSMRDETLRLRAAYAAQIGRLDLALMNANRSVHMAERYNHLLSLGLGLAARAKLRARMDRPGAELDAIRSRELLDEIGAPDCYILRVEGWAS